MPPFLKLLAYVGTAAMLWVGGGIVIHGMEEFGIAEPGHSIHHFAEAAGAGMGAMGPTVTWLLSALGSGLFGIALGGIIVAALHLRPRKTAH
jgi:predicted DNA repair protein MutK